MLRLIENNEIAYKVNGIVHKHENLFIKILKNLINLKKILLTWNLLTWIPKYMENNETIFIRSLSFIHLYL